MWPVSGFSGKWMDGFRITPSDGTYTTRNSAHTAQNGACCIDIGHSTFPALSDIEEDDIMHIMGFFQHLDEFCVVRWDVSSSVRLQNNSFKCKKCQNSF